MRQMAGTPVFEGMALQPRLLSSLHLAAVISAALAACAGPDDPSTPDAASDDGPADIAAAVDTAPHVWTMFNWPRAHGGSDPTITNELIRMVNATPSGETIRGNFFILDQPGLAKALNAAYDRGVTMRLTLDGTPANRAKASARSVASHMGTSAGFCGGSDPATGTVGCITSAVGGIAHIKFLTFSRTKAPNGIMYRNVTWFGSYNANGSSGDEDSNSGTAVYNSPASFDGMVAHQVRMQNQIHYANNDYFDVASNRGYIHDATAQLEYYLSPQQGGNLVLDQLARITPDPGCVIRVFEAGISDSMMPSINKLVSLQHKVNGVRLGCQVFVLTDVIGTTALSTLKAAGIEVRHLTNMHDKIFLIDGTFDHSAAHRQIVYTGSHNWSTKASYGNDELLVGIERANQYVAFYQHFLDGWHAATML